jgi:hypothetical protein
VLAFSGIYKTFLVLHLVFAIVGYGALVGAGVLGARSVSRGPGEAATIFDFIVTARWAEWVVYAVPVLGIVLVLLSDDAWKFSQAWISISFALFIIQLGVLHGAHLPNLRRMNELMKEVAGAPVSQEGGRPPQVDELAARGKRAGLYGAILNVALIAIVVMMVWKPGAPYSG